MSESASSHPEGKFVDRQRAFQQCLQAFIDRDYAGCAGQAMSLLSTGATHELRQLLLISLQRSGQTVRIEQLGPRVLEATAEHPGTIRCCD